tara:strand:- start:882 stop:1760 length:879 start_codon:yes stop_codon:yes gene_type:complete
MRERFIFKLIEQAKLNTKIFLIVGDLGYSVVEPFKELFPDRFLNVGVAEQNLAGIAAGLASEGMQVFVYSIGNFPTFRCAEFIRNDIDYHKLPVTIVAVGSGLSYGNLGYSHHAIQDYGLIRMMQNFLIYSPSDEIQLESCLDHLFKNPGPSYLRIDKNVKSKIHSNQIKIKPGRWVNLTKDKTKKNTFLITGNTSEYANLLVKKSKFKDFQIHSLPIWGLKLKKYQNNQLKSFDKVITIEDHLHDNGFGSWLLESVYSRYKNKIESFALSDRVIGKVGDQKYLNKYMKYFK